jgi:LmbE family N-acetylglucosaminyl deacetylase
MNVLVVAAHPDDEVLGMGGTIARHSFQGDKVSVLFLTDGVSSRQGADSEAQAKRKMGAERACGLLGASIFSFQSFPDNELDGIRLLSVIRVIEQAKASTMPEAVYTHHGGDLNVDHRIACQAVVTAFRPQPHDTYTELATFEVNSSTDWSHPSLTAPFNPDTFVDISDFLDRKLAAYECYADEVRQDPHARSLQAIEYSAKCRGRQVGVQAAEAFVTLRRIVR